MLACRRLLQPLGDIDVVELAIMSYFEQSGVSMLQLDNNLPKQIMWMTLFQFGSSFS